MTRSFSPDEDEQTGLGTLAPWESLVVDAVGHVIDFWKFKRNQGRLWALLYLRDRAMSAQELQDALGLSKGAVSMIVREAEQWGVVIRVRDSGDASWRFVAESDLMKMVGRVIEEREGALVRRVLHDLERAQKLATQARVDAKIQERLGRMVRLAQLSQRAVETFVATARFDFGRAASVLRKLRGR